MSITLLCVACYLRGPQAGCTFFRWAFVMKRSPADLVPALLIGGLVWIQTGAFASAQGLDDLFEQPTDARFETRAQDEIGGSSDTLGAATPPYDRSAVGSIPLSDRSLAPRPVASSSDLKLVDEDSGSASRDPLRMTAMELRQARALEQTRSRIARLEAARWAGSPTLRPSWNPSPTTASRFPNRNYVRVPVYIRSR